MGIFLGYVGYVTYYRAVNPAVDPSPVDVLYLIIQLVWFNSYSGPGDLPWTLQAARFIVPAVVLFAAIKGLLMVFYEQLEALRVRRFRDHAIVCGLGQKGLFITRRLREQGERVVLIERSRSAEHIAAARLLGARVLIGDATQIDTLERARAGRARRLIAVTGSDDQNAAIAAAARDVSTADGGALGCSVHVGNLDLFEALGEQRLNASESQRFWFELFCVSDGAARAALSAHAPFDVEPGDKPAGYVQIAVSGHGPVARSLVAHAGKRWQLAYPDGRERLRVTLLDPRADAIAAHLVATYPHLAQACEFLPPASGEGYIPNTRPPHDACGHPLVTIVYVCGEADADGDWSTALRLEQSLRESSVPVILFTLSTSGIAALVGARSQHHAVGGLTVFPVIESACEPDLLFGGLWDELARAIHANYVASENAKETPDRKPADDRAMRPWSELDEDLRDQNRDQAADIGGKLRTVDCDLAPLGTLSAPPFVFNDDELETLSRREHERWMEYKSSQGWRFGSNRDDAAKLHPDMRPWDDLDEETKEKDRDAVRLIPALVQMAGHRVYRRG